MDEPLLVPDGTSRTEFTEKHSRFIGQCFPVSNEKEVKEIVKQLWEEHPGARHVVYAFITGKKNSRTEGMSDDGEPKGTAGSPVLQVLNGSGVTNVLCTVVRYFGGTLLGTGGLVKAYTQSAKDAIGALPIKELIEENSFYFDISYDFYDQIRYILKNRNVRIEKEDFSEKIRIEGVIAAAAYEALEKEIKNISAGKIELIRK